MKDSKSGLLSIGELAKLTRVGVRALHYYDRKNILKPAYIDSDTGYRYYSAEQSYLVDLIVFCVELDIPLKELKDVFDSDDTSRLWNFLVKKKEAAEKKLKLLSVGLSFMNKALKKIETSKLYQSEQIYMREIEEKIYYLTPCERQLGDINRIKQINAFAEEVNDKLRTEISIDDVDDYDSVVLLEYGFLCEYSPQGVKQYLFTEIPKTFRSENSITIPSGSYYFRQDKTSKIECAPKIFEEQLAGKNTYMIMEIEESFNDNKTIHELIYELRLIAL